MMIKSMTGYGRAKKELDNVSVLAEMKSVNHRFNEVTVRMPRQFLLFEDKIKRIVQEHTARGKIDVFLTIEGEGAVLRSLDIDWTLCDLYFQRLQEMKQRYSVNDAISLEQLVTLPDIFHVSETEGNVELLSELVDIAVKEAVSDLVNMRITEGKRLFEDVMNQLKEIQKAVSILYGLADEVVVAYRKRLESRVQELLGDNYLPDENRLLTEIAIFAEKADINEELTRLNSHIAQFEASLHIKEPVGRKLDFLVQEMNREMNTIGAKANDACISRNVVEMKSALEKIKEQVQNIE